MEPVKVVLSVEERLYFPALKLPHGSMVENDMASALIARVAMTEAEKKDYEMEGLPDGRISWNQQKAKLREFMFESYEILLIQQGIKMLDERKAIPSFANALAKKLLDVTVVPKNKK